MVTTTRTAMALGREICERDPRLAAQRDARLLAEQSGAARTVLRQDVIPGLIHGLVDPDSPAAGSTLPQPYRPLRRLRRAPRRPHRGRRPGRRRRTVWLRGMGQHIVIARPDHYVYGTASSVAGAVALLPCFRDRLAGLPDAPAQADGA